MKKLVTRMLIMLLVFFLVWKVSISFISTQVNKMGGNMEAAIEYFKDNDYKNAIKAVTGENIPLENEGILPDVLDKGLEQKGIIESIKDIFNNMGNDIDKITE